MSTEVLLCYCVTEITQCIRTTQAEQNETGFQIPTSGFKIGKD